MTDARLAAVLTGVDPLDGVAMADARDRQRELAGVLEGLVAGVAFVEAAEALPREMATFDSAGAARRPVDDSLDARPSRRPR